MFELLAINVSSLCSGHIDIIIPSICHFPLTLTINKFMTLTAKIFMFIPEKCLNHQLLTILFRLELIKTLLSLFIYCFSHRALITKAFSKAPCNCSSTALSHFTAHGEMTTVQNCFFFLFNKSQYVARIQLLCSVVYDLYAV